MGGWTNIPLTGWDKPQAASIGSYRNLKPTMTKKCTGIKAVNALHSVSPESYEVATALRTGFARCTHAEVSTCRTSWWLNGLASRS